MKSNKHLLIPAALLLVMLTAAGNAQLLPPVINYQGQLLDANGVPANGNLTMAFSIFDAFNGGTALYSETQNVTVSNGLFNALIGSATPIPQTLFDNGAGLALEITVNGDVMSPRRPLTSAAYAFNTSGGDVTAVNAGVGVAGGGASGDVAVNLADNGVTSTNILDGTITSADLGFSSVSSAAIAADAVEASELAADAVTTSKFASGAVGSNKLTNIISLGEAGISNGQLQVNSSTLTGPALKVWTYSAGSGLVNTYNDNSDQVGELGKNTANAGYLGIHGPNGSFNGEFNSITNFPNHGLIFVFDDVAGLPRAPAGAIAGMQILGNGNGEIFADTKHFRMTSPRAADQEIWYAAIEGPEAAAYIRGTARLINGRAVVTLPDHFQIVAAGAGLTARLTPLDPNSKGLAVVAKSATGIEVQELRQGAGSYDFDWEVKCPRKGHENFSVLRSRSEVMAAPTMKKAETR